MTLPRNPARYSDAVLDKIAELCDPSWSALDPFAGEGRCHELAARRAVRLMVGIEIEREWAIQHPCTIHGNVLEIDNYFLPSSFDAVITSPAYGNRMADSHDARERCKACKTTGVIDGQQCPKCKGDGFRSYKRLTYKHALGHDLHEDNSGQLQWGPQYRGFHELAWSLVVPVLRPGGTFILNCKDHIRKGIPQLVTEWHLNALKKLGLLYDGREFVPTPGMRFGQNRNVRTDGEWIVVLRKPL